MRVMRWLSGSLVLFLLLGGLSSQARAAEFYYDIYVDTSGLTGYNPGNLSIQFGPLNTDTGGNTFSATTTVLQGAGMLSSPYYSNGITGNDDLTAGPVTMQVNTGDTGMISPYPGIAATITYGSELELQVAFDTGPSNTMPLTGTAYQLTLYNTDGTVILPSDNGLMDTATIFTYSDGSSLTNPAAIPAYVPGGPPTQIVGPFYNATPEPSTGVLFGVATVMLGGWAGWRRRGALRAA